MAERARGAKVEWSGLVLGVQPRIRLLRPSTSDRMSTSARSSGFRDASTAMSASTGSAATAGWRTETYHRHGRSCTWGCLMPVEMIIDHWKPDVRRYRQETFCYGPKSCRLYRAGPTRKVPGRRRMTYEEENWVDAEETGHRGRDE